MTLAMDQPRPPVAELTAVTVTGRDRVGQVLLKAVDWRIAAGDCWVVAGAPGSGKSDLLATLAGLQRPAAGQVALFGRAVATLGDRELGELRRRIGVVFENGGRLFHTLSLAENIALPLCYHQNCGWHEVASRVDALMRFAGVADWGRVTPGRLRPAIRQRAALARALALRPELLLVDNPVADLPAQEVQWWRETIRQLATGHAVLDGAPLTLVLACDDLSPWTDVAGRFARLHDRRWMSLGGPGELARHRDQVLRDMQEPK